MGIFFKTPKHLVFDYKPRYYDPRKEALDKKIADAEKRNSGEYVPGDSIRSGFKRIRFENKRSKGASGFLRFITIIGFILILVALMYLTDAVNVLMSSF